MGNAINKITLNQFIEIAKKNISKEDILEYQPKDEGMGKCENWIYYKYENKKILVELWSKPNSTRKRIEENNQITYSWDCCNCQNRYHGEKCVNNNKVSIIHYQ